MNTPISPQHQDGSVLCMWSRLDATARTLLLTTATTTTGGLSREMLQSRRSYWHGKLPIYSSLGQGGGSPLTTSFLTPAHILLPTVSTSSSTTTNTSASSASGNRALARSIAAGPSGGGVGVGGTSSSEYIRCGRVMGLVGVEVMQLVRVGGSMGGGTDAASTRQQDLVILVRDPFRETASSSTRRQHPSSSSSQQQPPSTMLCCIHGECLDMYPNILVPGTGLLLDTPTALPLSSPMAQPLGGGGGVVSPSSSTIREVPSSNPLPSQRHVFLIVCARNILSVIDPADSTTGSTGALPNAHHQRVDHHQHHQTPVSNGHQVNTPHTAHHPFAGVQEDQIQGRDQQHQHHHVPSSSSNYFDSDATRSPHYESRGLNNNNNANFHGHMVGDKRGRDGEVDHEHLPPSQNTTYNNNNPFTMTNNNNAVVAPLPYSSAPFQSNAASGGEYSNNNITHNHHPPSTGRGGMTTALPSPTNSLPLQPPSLGLDSLQFPDEDDDPGELW